MAAFWDAADKALMHQEFGFCPLYNGLFHARNKVCGKGLGRISAVRGHIAGTCDKHGYRVVAFKGRPVFAHRIIWAMLYGVDGMESKVIDHIDGNKANNAPSNLRLVSPQTNSENIRTKRRHAYGGAVCTSKYIGVSRHRSGRWEAKISTKGKMVHLGIHDTELEARVSYLRAKKALHAGAVL